jgi:hypothetical protein
VSAKEDIVSFMVISSTQKLLAEVNVFLAKTGMSSSYLGKAAANNSEAVKRLELGRTVSLETADKLRLFMSSYQPKQKRDDAEASSEHSA